MKAFFGDGKEEEELYIQYSADDIGNFASL
jgi:hypothetical protein